MLKWFKGMCVFSGYGVIAPATYYGRLVCIVYAYITIPLYLIALAVIGETLADLFKKLFWLVCCCGCYRKGALQELKVMKNANNLREVMIPLTLTLSLLLVWVILGAGIWMVLESDWKFADSIYFCFITISTIGFGDLVPEVDLSSGEGHLKLVVIITYITVGMAAMSMCFQLMADEFMSKLKWLGKKCGCAKSQPAALDDMTQLASD
ncbi:KCNK17 [Bugula neritina]|uniref:KCNK17 n=1 Tax=Bugula neritina TaxID=10212 RepID=A0A7J7JU20_BUGNE|nr:KCNK17 [Bugula neritina]